MKGSKGMKKKFNLIDALVILVVIAVVAFIGIKLSNGFVEKPLELEKFQYTFHVEEMPDYVKDYIKEGDTASSADNNDVFGVVTGKTFGDAEIYTENAEGKVIKSTKEGHSSADIVIEGEALQTPSGVKLDKGVYGVGHSMAIKIGNAKVYGKISGIVPVK